MSLYPLVNTVCTEKECTIPCDLQLNWTIKFEENTSLELTDLAIPKGNGACQLAIKAYNGSEIMLGTWLMREYTWVFDNERGIGFAPMGPLEHLPSIDSLGHSEKNLMVIILLLFIILAIYCCICMRRERAIEESERRIDKGLLK